ncbi:MAG: DUF4838 domain-containing protein, partial [Kiritimatiellae bacterium]|nr:DUF4838 domain-containing protein [Kiritimatiellia bacterium]
MNMTKMTRTLAFAGLACCFGCDSDVVEVKLVDNGVAKCRIVLDEGATPPERFGAAELAKYLSRATGCGELNGAYPICVKVKGHPALKEDGFAIEVTPEKMTIVGANPRGALSGCYEILKRSAGMRWVAPGEDCEYCVLAGKSVTVPCGREVQNPHLNVRNTCATDLASGLWLVRNNMHVLVGARQFAGVEGERMLELAAKGRATGGHILGDLLVANMPGKDGKERADNLLKAHPEWCPLVDGMRVPTWTAHTPNPCVSDPGCLNEMAKSLVRRCREPHGAEDFITIGNNDTTVWCQCENCRKLDAPEMKNTRGELSDRYWHMVNEIARRVWEEVPDAKLGGWAYQNFWYAPVHVKPDPRLRVLISFNNQCWRHSACDPACEVNKEMVKIYAGWKKLGMKYLVNRDEIGAWDGIGSPGCDMLPSESVLAKSIAEYPQIGCTGSSFCLNGPFPEFSGFAKNWAPFYGRRYHWWAMWQTAYVSSIVMWNPKADWQAALGEANRLFYGTGWEAGMKEFRALLTDCFLKTPGCIGWGQGITTGRCLDRPGSEEKLVASLERALAAAKAAGDERAAAHIAREQEIFRLTWLKARKTHVESYREMTAYKRTGEIAVDGVLDERDWQAADSYSNFQAPPWNRGPGFDPQKTYMKVVYDRDHLYFGIEAMEPMTDKMIAGDKVDRFAEGCGTLGNHLELFYSYPDMNQAAWHMMVNSKGQIIDALQKSATVRDLSVVTKAKWAVKVLPDRWTLEMAIPCTEIGQNILDGMTWKVNCARQREVEGVKRSASTAASGNFHGTANFVNVKFLAARSGTGAHDLSSWKNANLNAGLVIATQYKPERIKGWSSPMMPRGWSLAQDSEASYQAK